ncbi:MAG: hypothetical protein AAF483_14460 [Planctomycetota bacterium]
MNKESPCDEKQDAFAELRELRSGLRANLQVTRQVNRGKPVYTLYDPVSFQAHRLSHFDYKVLSCLNDNQTLQNSFEDCVARGFLQASNEEQFYSFIKNLDLLGLLSTSQQSHSSLYKKFLAKQAAERKSKIFDFLFLTIPLSNPDRFLDRTYRYFSFLFTKAALCVWLVALTFFLAVLFNRWSDFVAPLNNLLAANNLVFMVIAFFGLKVLHEFGHGYACKNFGGRVPEMGCKLIVGMPLAYVDASSAWSFHSRAQRIVVMLGGMYFESLVAIPALLIWAAMPNSIAGSCAYQLVFMAGVATILFNANPFMKFDGYFMLSDLVGIPNLRTKAILVLQQTLQRRVLGMQVKPFSHGGERIFLFFFGLGSVLYTTLIMISISGIVVARLHFVGLILAGYKLGSLAFGLLKKLFNFLLFSEATEEVRPRARFVAFCLATGIPSLLFLAPIPTGIQVQGIVSAQKSTVIRANTAGILRQVEDLNNHPVEAGQPLATLENIDTTSSQKSEEIAADASTKQAFFVSRQDLAEATKLQSESRFQQYRLMQADRQKRELQILAPHSGKLVFIVPDYTRGAFVRTGDPIAKIVDGETRIRTYLTESQLSKAKTRSGEIAGVRLLGEVGGDWQGVVSKVAPASIEALEDVALSTISDGKIAVDPETGKPLDPIFLIEIKIPELRSHDTLQDLRAQVLFGRKYDTVGSHILRTLRNLIHTMFAT